MRRATVHSASSFLLGARWIEGGEPRILAGLNAPAGAIADGDSSRYENKFRVMGAKNRRRISLAAPVRCWSFSAYGEPWDALGSMEVAIAAIPVSVPPAGVARIDEDWRGPSDHDRLRHISHGRRGCIHDGRGHRDYDRRRCVDNAWLRKHCTDDGCPDHGSRDERSRAVVRLGRGDGRRAQGGDGGNSNQTLFHDALLDSCSPRSAFCWGAGSRGIACT